MKLTSLTQSARKEVPARRHDRHSAARPRALQIAQSSRFRFRPPQQESGARPARLMDIADQYSRKRALLAAIVALVFLAVACGSPGIHGAHSGLA